MDAYAYACTHTYACHGTYKSASYTYTHRDAHIDRSTYREMRRVRWACVIYAKRGAHALAVLEGLLTYADVC